MKNLLIRSISGLMFMVLVIGALLLGPITFTIIFGLVMSVAIYEYLTISFGNKYRFNLVYVKAFAIVAAVSLFLNTLLVLGYGYSIKFLLFPIIPIILIFIGNLYIKNFNKHGVIVKDGVSERECNGYEAFPFALSSFAYIAIPFSMMFLVLFKNGEYNSSILLSMLIMLWCTDVGAYCLGSTLGQKFNHRLFLSISPKKSWEGFWGGLVCSVLSGIVLYYLEYLKLSLLQSVVLSIIICIFGTLGDLVESQFKRNYGVKDSGSIMPGHGGMLDRFDGALVAFPIAIIYLLFVL